MACEKCSANGDNVKHKQRESAEKKALLTRLSRIEGQVRGVRAMVEDDRYCVDIVTQVSAIQAALNGFNKELLARPHEHAPQRAYPEAPKCPQAFSG